MLASSDCALLIGDPALRVTAAAESAEAQLRAFDLAGLWHEHTGLGFVFAMWMSRHAGVPVDLAAARDEGLEHIDEIAANYVGDINLPLDELKRYLTENISYTIDEEMQAGLELYFELAVRHGLIERNRPLVFAD
jgi:chorismate dehydratase